ncbi:hypothetical protein BZA05DRAFT_381766 [Tricharina praecox]|uniref:uncharacterized protein n=1 Tax=Tricharina praecox TaxID=43433 RepID=UPI00221E68E9|nr:uncharacterized protein BZA05DRAFT_381766 [Tricharina praecox]KAI5858576.1 hypothetical protein BZA05DRAFT_381766 [Tricharina praecox]
MVSTVLYLLSVVNAAHPRACLQLLIEGEKEKTSPVYDIEPLPSFPAQVLASTPSAQIHTFKYNPHPAQKPADMAKSSFTNMFNRLPIYSRPPKEPCIGEPVLTHTSNEQLSGKVPASVFRPPPSHEFDNHLGILPTGRMPSVMERGLPSIPT